MTYLYYGLKQLYEDINAIHKQKEVIDHIFAKNTSTIISLVDYFTEI